MIAYISGHLDLTLPEFSEHYKERIALAVLIGDTFVVGDAFGADWMAQTYLASLGKEMCDFTVYHMLEKPRHTYLGYKLVGGFQSDEERDAAMTAASDYDIAWVRPGRENSGTARNLARRKQ